MKNIKIAALLILICLAVIYAACSQDKTATTEGGQSAPEITDESVETTEESYYDKLGERDFGGGIFMIIDSSHHPDLHINMPDEEGVNGDPINDALYNRDKLIEDKYNVNIKYTLIHGFGDGCKALERSVLSGTHEYDLLVSPVFGNSLDAISTRNVLHNMIGAPYLSLTSPWWSKMIYENMQFNNKLFYTGGDIFLPSYSQCPAVIMYNKKLFRDHGIEDNLYSLVFDGKWTLDALNAIIKDRDTDLNSDGKMHADDDFYGLISQNITVAMGFYLAGVGVNFSTVNNENITVDLTSPLTLNKIDKLSEMIERYTYRDQEDPIQKTFKGNRALFLTHCMISPQLNLRDMDEDYGILPMPKWDEAQPSYISFINAWGSGFVGVPLNADLEKSAFLTEAMAYAGYEYLRRPVYDITFKAKGARDEESERIIDIIIETAYLDIGSVYNFGGTQEILLDAIVDNKPFVSAYEKKEGNIARDIEKFIASMSADVE